MTTRVGNSRKTLPSIVTPFHPGEGIANRQARMIIYLVVAVSLIVSLVLILVNPTRASVLAYDLFWWTVDGGGGNSQGSSYSLSGAIGQSDAGASQGGSYTLAGGFWSSAPSVIYPDKYEILLPLVKK